MKTLVETSSVIFTLLSLRNRFQTYKDDTTFEKGDEVWPALVHAIDNSFLCIVVFSENYTSSTWCLRELTHVLECNETLGILIKFHTYQT